VAIRADDVDLRRDATLVERFQAGDVAGFEDLYRRYYQRLFRFCLKRVGDAQEAEELTQEAFTRAYSAMPRLAGERRFYPWLSGIASRLCADTHRRRARSEVRPEIDTGVVDGGHEQIFAAVDRELVQAALARLGPRHREVLRLREEQGWTYQRIADHFDVSLGAVEQLLWRARRSLRREFEAVAGADARLAGIPLLGWLARRLSALRSRFGDVASQAAPVLANATVSLAIVAGGAAVVAGDDGPAAARRHSPETVVVHSGPVGSTAVSDAASGSSASRAPARRASAGPNDASSTGPSIVSVQNERQPDPEQRVATPLLGVDANPQQVQAKVSSYVTQVREGAP
jgi:RNA polymerase sigma-70 factor, ECF subfamily